MELMFFLFVIHFQLVEDAPHLNGAVEEAAVLARLIHQAFGECERHHAAWLVGFLQASSGFLKHLRPCLGVRACNCVVRASIIAEKMSVSQTDQQSKYTYQTLFFIPSPS